MLTEETIHRYLDMLMTGPVAVTRTRPDLPGFVRAQYNTFRIDLRGQEFLGIAVKQSENFSISAFAKHLKTIGSAVAADWVLLFDRLPNYQAHRLRSMGMPFVVPFQQMFWPAIGQVIQASNTPPVAARLVPKLSPASQAAVIAAMNGVIPTRINVTELAVALRLSKMSSSRIINELLSAKIGFEDQSGRQRMLVLPETPKELWDIGLPFLASPVRQTFFIQIGDLPAGALQSGETALAAQTMLVAPPVPVYALSRELTALLEHRSIPDAESGTAVCEVEKWKYDPQVTARDNYVDNFSLYLSLRDNRDDRLQIALKELLGDYFDTRDRDFPETFRRPF